MDYKKLNRDTAIDIFGIEPIQSLDDVNCTFTNRVVDSEYVGMVEFSAYIEHDKYLITAYYYQTEEDIAQCEELDSLTWEIDHYEIEGLE